MTSPQILWVDEEMYPLRTFSYHLTRSGYTLKSLETVTAAFHEIGSHAPGTWPYFLTILDINMQPAPGEYSTEVEAETAGVRILRALQERHPSANVLLVSGVFERLDEHMRRELQNVPRIDKANLLIDTLPEYIAKLTRKFLR